MPDLILARLVRAQAHLASGRPSPLSTLSEIAREQRQRQYAAQKELDRLAAGVFFHAGFTPADCKARKCRLATTVAQARQAAEQAEYEAGLLMFGDVAQGPL